MEELECRAKEERLGHVLALLATEQPSNHDPTPGIDFQLDDLSVPLDLMPLQDIGRRVIVPFLDEGDVPKYRPSNELGRWTLLVTSTSRPPSAVSTRKQQSADLVSALLNA